MTISLNSISDTFVAHAQYISCEVRTDVTNNIRMAFMIRRVISHTNESISASVKIEMRKTLGRLGTGIAGSNSAHGVDIL